MKRYGHLYEKITDLANIALALQRSQRGKRHYKEVKMINQDPDHYIDEIREMLINKTFRNSPYDEIERIEGNKLRQIKKLPYYPDRIIHHAIMQVMEPIWVRTLIRDTYQSIPGRGVHLAARRIKKALIDNDATRYCLKLDVRKFYPSIKNDIMKRVIRAKIKDPNLLWLLDEIIDSTAGLPIGNYISQILGNLYLSELDHRIKEIHGVKYYYRYCDDLVLLGSSKEQLRTIFRDIQSYLACERGLDVKGNWQIFPVAARGIDFLGYRFFPGYTLLRNSVKKQFIKALSRPWRPHYINSVMSYMGWLQAADTERLIMKYLTPSVCGKINYLSLAAGHKNPLEAQYAAL